MQRPWVALGCLAIGLAGNGWSADAVTRNVILVMSDGLRWQEIFRGAEESLMDKPHGGVKDPDALRKAYWRETTEARREVLMPFVWSVMARQGQVWGNRQAGSEAWVTNGLNFSYPGYNETLTGAPDPRVKSNDKIPNPNVTVFEWLHGKPAYRGKVAAFGAWDVFPFIFNAQRAGFLVNAGYDPLTVPPVSPAIALLNRVKAETRVWGDEVYDSFLFHTAFEYATLHKPRVLFIGLGDTDDFAHEGRYDLYLDAAHRADAYLRELWDTVQGISEYRGKTALIFLPDHGRGEGPEWKTHGEKVPDSKYIWMGFLGPEVRPLGERKGVSPVTQSQIAATLAAMLGEDYAGAVPKMGKPIGDVLRRND
jgi:hypothetical protein